MKIFVVSLIRLTLQLSMIPWDSIRPSHVLCWPYYIFKSSSHWLAVARVYCGRKFNRYVIWSSDVTILVKLILIYLIHEIRPQWTTNRGRVYVSINFRKIPGRSKYITRNERVYKGEIWIKVLLQNREKGRSCGYFCFIQHIELLSPLLTLLWISSVICLKVFTAQDKVPIYLVDSIWTTWNH